jgi:hypothetical protein
MMTWFRAERERSLQHIPIISIPKRNLKEVYVYDAYPPEGFEKGIRRVSFEEMFGERGRQSFEYLGTAGIFKRPREFEEKVLPQIEASWKKMIDELREKGLITEDKIAEENARRSQLGLPPLRSLDQPSEDFINSMFQQYLYLKKSLEDAVPSLEPEESEDEQSLLGDDEEFSLVKWLNDIPLAKSNVEAEGL